MVLVENKLKKMGPGLTAGVKTRLDFFLPQ